MAQQRGMKRAEKVLKRSRKLKQRAKEANERKLMRMMQADGEQAEAESTDEASKKKD